MRSPSSFGRGTARVLTGLAAGAVLAAVVVVVGLPSAGSAEATAPAPVVAPTAVVAAPVVGTPPAPTPTVTPEPVATPTSRKPRATTTRTKRAASCAEAAMQRGRFDPSCDEYQGYLDPGTAGGREPTSGEIQSEWACEQGLVPRSDCGS